MHHILTSTQEKLKSISDTFESGGGDKDDEEEQQSQNKEKSGEEEKQQPVNPNLGALPRYFNSRSNLEIPHSVFDVYFCLFQRCILSGYC